MKRVLLIIFAVVPLLSAGCIDEEIKQEAKFATDATISIGAVENQPLRQKIDWRVNVANTADRTAENVTADVILHPEVASRLHGPYEDRVVLGDMPRGTGAGFGGTAYFNATGLSKRDIVGWKPLVSVKLTWIEGASDMEQVINAS